jgi:RNA polymerase sigma-70 factor, ECF subfamily
MIDLDEAGFNAMVGGYRRRLYWYAIRMLGNREDAEEAVQDAFMRAYIGWHKMAAEQRESLRTSGWLFKITLNVVRNRVRKRQPVRVSLDDLNDPDSWRGVLEDPVRPDSVLERNADVALVEGAIQQLPVHLREAAWLRFIEGLTHPEIARISSQPIGTVKSHVFRATLLLRRMLAPALGKSA